MIDSSGAAADSHRRPLPDENPLLRLWHDSVHDPSDRTLRDRAIRDYAFAIPNDDALRTIAEMSPNGVVEIGAGTGYWARLLDVAGVDVIACDVAPAPSSDNRWFGATEPWFDVLKSDHRMASAHVERSLLLVWPTLNEDWPAQCLQQFAEAGGQTVVFVGEPPGGHTGDDRFHALLGEYDRCWGCALQVPTMPCVCGVVPVFRRTEQVQLPHWAGFGDDLFAYMRTDQLEPLDPGLRRWTRRFFRPFRSTAP